MVKIFPIYETTMGYVIFVEKGKRSEFDFRAKYYLSDRKPRTPKYIHFAIDLYGKMGGNTHLTTDLIDYLIKLIAQLPPEKQFPPELLFFTASIANKYSPLDIHGEYTVEFFLPIFELFLRQKKQEYPNSMKSFKFLQSLRRRDDIYTIIQTIL